MKTVKMSLANLEGKLSRKEMKGIMAGSGSGYCGTCVGGVGSWYGNSSSASCAQTGYNYCSSQTSICRPCYW